MRRTAARLLQTPNGTSGGTGNGGRSARPKFWRIPSTTPKKDGEGDEAAKSEDASSSRSPSSAAVAGRLARMKIRPLIDPETKTVRTAAGDLPISPLMDESYLEATRRYKRAKPKPNFEAHGSAERQLLRNPYARALATPIRYDSITETHLPRYFLQGFGLAAHPTTGEAWLAPQDIMNPSWGGGAEDGEEEVETSEASGPETDGTAEEVVPSTSSISSTSSPATTTTTAGCRQQQDAGAQRPSPSPSVGVGAYTLARQDLMRAMSAGKGRFVGKWHRVASLTKHPGAVARKDMHSFVLDLMRRRAVESILEFAQLRGRYEDDDADGEEGKKYIVRLDGWDEVGMHAHRGCVLWFGDGEGPPGTTGEEGPPPNTPAATLGATEAEAPSVHSAAEPGAAEAQEDTAPGIVVPPGSESIEEVAETAKILGEFATIRTRGSKKSGTKYIPVPVHDLVRMLGDENVARLRAESPLFSEGSIFLVVRRRTVDLQLLLWKIQGYLAEYKDYS